MARRILKEEQTRPPLVVELTCEEVQWLHAFVRESDGTTLAVLYEIFEAYLSGLNISGDDVNPISDRVTKGSVRDLIEKGFVWGDGVS